MSTLRVRNGKGAMPTAACWGILYLDYWHSHPLPLLPKGAASMRLTEQIKQVGKLSWMMKSSRERIRFAEWCYLLALDCRRDEVRAGRNHELRESEVRAYLKKRIPRHDKYKAVPTWLLMILINYALKLVMRWLRDGKTDEVIGHA